jgi:hypothetical protein
MLYFFIKIPGDITDREYTEKFALELGQRIMKASLVDELADIYEKQNRDGIRTLDCKDGVRACFDGVIISRKSYDRLQENEERLYRLKDTLLSLSQK